MTGAEILHRAQEAGLHLRVDGNRIMARPPRALTPDLAATIRANRPAVIVALTGARILRFPSRPAGTAYRLLLSRDYVVDAVKDGEPCPSCQGTDWRLTPPGLWIDDAGHYWSPRRLAEKSGSGTAPAPGIEPGRPA